MSVIYFLIPLSIVFATAFLCGFIWAVRSGQYEDTSTPALRPLMDEPHAATSANSTNSLINSNSTQT